MRLIEADALMGRIIQRSQALITPNGKAGYLGLFVKDIQQVVDDAPTINPDDLRPQGRWIQHNKENNNWVECSECNTVGSPFWKCCPVCTAMMDGKEQGNDNT